MRENRPLAILLFLCAGLAIVGMSGIVRRYSPVMPTGQIMFWRSGMAMPVILAYMALRGEFPGGLRTRRVRAHTLRALLAMAAMACSFGSLAYISVAMSTAIGFLAPVLVLPMAALFLGERLTVMRVLATGLGAVGVALVVLRALSLPQEGAVFGTLLALGFAVLLAVARIVVKDLTRTERPATVAIYFALAGTSAGAITALWGWEPLSHEAMAMLSLAGVFGALAHICSAEALARAPISVLAPIEYSQLIWAAGIDYVVFATIPGGWAVLGMGIITASGLLVWIDRRS